MDPEDPHSDSSPTGEATSPPDDLSSWARIGGTLLFGTVHSELQARAAPLDKAGREVFWCRALVEWLPEYQAEPVSVAGAEDDSHGGDDVVITRGTGTIGVQVTELTNQIQRHRRAHSALVARKIGQALAMEGHGIQPATPVIMSLGFDSDDFSELDSLDPTKALNWLKSALKDPSRTSPMRIAPGVSAMLIPVHEGRILVGRVGNIGISVPNELPYTLQTYRRAVERIAEKKSKSRSPWLIIWSADFWRDAHVIEEAVVKYMRSVFADSKFERVYFLHSHDAERFFKNSLKVHRVK